MSLYKEIASQADIIQVISNYIKIIRKGKGYVAICPFHHDTNPSLHIDPQKQIYKCFSCNAGGSVIKFVKEYENISYIKAAKKVIDICGLNIKIENYQDDTIPLTPMHKVMADALQFYSYLLINSMNSKPYQWLKKRNIDEKLMEYFKLGWAPKSRKELLNFLVGKGYTKNILLKSNLITVNSKDELVDYFAERILYPLFDKWQNVVGFCGRTITNEEPKYISMPNSSIFNKGSLLFNHPNVLNNRTKDIVLVEGMHDVITLTRKKIDNVMALMGTTLTIKQLEILKNFKSVLLLLDPDDAGKNATTTIKELLLTNGLEIRLLNNEITKDPDDFFTNMPKQKVKEFLNNFTSFKNKIINNKSNYIQNSKKIKTKKELKLWKPEIQLLKNYLLNSDKLIDFYFHSQGRMASEPAKEICDYLLYVYFLNLEKDVNKDKIAALAYQMLTENTKKRFIELLSIDSNKYQIKDEKSWLQLVSTITKIARKNDLKNNNK